MLGTLDAYSTRSNFMGDAQKNRTKVSSRFRPPQLTNITKLRLEVQKHVLQEFIFDSRFADLYFSFGIGYHRLLGTT